MLLSRNYAPSPALAPFVRRHYVFSAELPADFELIDRLLSETAFIRILLKGEWLGEAEPGVWRGAGPMVFFGANSLPFHVRVKGSFLVVGTAIRPSGWSGLFTQHASNFADRMFALQNVWGDAADRMHAGVLAAEDDSAIVEAIESVVTEQIDRVGIHRADPAMRAFEDIARADSTIRVSDAAARVGLSLRAMERQCAATFGHSPKAVLRRSRFLDMATALRGFSDPSAEERAALRFSDQSHMNREFRRFAGMTPKQFEKAATPLLTAGLKLRADGIS